MAKSTRIEQIRRAVAEYIACRRAGQVISPQDFARTVPHLQPELLQHLSSPDLNGDADALHVQSTIIVAAPDDVAEASIASAAVLQIRCPECREGIHLAADAPWDRIRCEHCGGTISLAGSAIATQRAATLQSIGHFDLIERLGVGGFGTVWKARDRMLHRTVAIKIPRKGALSESEAEQFLQEARAAAQLSHPNIVSVHEVGEEGGTPYIVSDFVRGMSLTEWLINNQPRPDETALLCEKIAIALHHAHQAGIVHRDVKPGNILIDSQKEPHIMDFGLAKRMVSDITMTLEGQVIGTPAYMSPEQARGDLQSITVRSDIYALGAVLYQMLTGELPFRGNVRMLVYQVIHEEPPSPRTLNNTIPRDLETICLKCLEKDPARRYSSALEFAQELQRYRRGEPILARPLGRLDRATRWIRRNIIVATLTASIITILAIAVSVSSWLAHGYMRIAKEKAQKQAELALQTQELQATLDSLLETQRRAIAARQDLAARGKYNTQLMTLSEQTLRFDPERAHLILSECDIRQRDFVWRWIYKLLCPPGYSLRDHLAPVSDVQFSRQGTWFATLGDDQRICLYESPRFLPHAQWGSIQSPVLRFRISDENPAKLAIQISPQQIQIVTPHLGTTGAQLSFDHPLLDFDFNATGAELWTLEASTNSTDSGPLRRWQTMTGNSVPQDIFPAANRFALGGDDSVAIQVADGIEIWTKQKDGVYALFKKQTGPLELGGFVWDNGAPCVVIAEPSPAIHGLSDRQQFKRSLWNLSTEEKRVLGIFIQPTPPLIPTWEGPMISQDPQGSQIMIYERQTLLPHTLLPENPDKIRCTAVSPHGDWVATGDQSGTVVLRQLSSPAQHDLQAQAAVQFALHPHGRYLAVADINNTVRLYDLDTGETLRELNGQRSRIEDLAFSADGKYLASCSRDKTMVIWNLIWDAPATDSVRQFRYSQPIRAIHFGADSNELIACDDDGTTSRWDLSVPNLVEQWPSHAKSAPASASSADGNWLATSRADGAVEIRRMSQGFTPYRILANHGAAISCLAVSNRGMLAVANDQRVIYFYDLTQPEAICAQGTIALRQPVLGKSHTRGITSMTFSQKDETLVVTDQSKQVQFWDVQAREQRGHVTPEFLNEEVLKADFCATREILVVMSSKGRIEVVNVGGSSARSELVADDIPISNLSCGIAFVDDEQYVGPGSDRFSICHGNLSGVRGTKQNSPKGPQAPLCLALSHDRSDLAVGHANGVVSVAKMKVPTEDFVYLFNAHSDRVSSLAYMEHPRTLVTTNGSEIKAWDLTSGLKPSQPLWIVEPRAVAGSITSLAGSPVHHLVALGTSQGEVAVLPGPEGPQSVTPLRPASQHRVRQLRFSPDGTLLAIATDDHGLEVWRLADHQRLHVMSGHVANVLTLDFSQDGQLLVTGGQDQTVRFWSIHTGQCLETIQTHCGWISGISCHPGDQGVLTLATNRTIQFWRRDLKNLTNVP